MIQINQKCLGVYHRLFANKKVGGMAIGEMKDVLIMQFTDKRFGVMGIFNKEAKKMDLFYVVIKDEKELHESFTEQFTIIPGFSQEGTGKSNPENLR